MQQSDGQIFEISKEQTEKLQALLGDKEGAPEEVTIGQTRFFRGNTVPKLEQPGLNRHERRKLAVEIRKDG